jgi:hypothetical protein
MTDKQNVKDFLCSNDPLSEDAIEFLIDHKEEDLFVDYKESFDGKDEKQWIGISIDAMAFANTMGGFIVFGIRDSGFSVVGLNDQAVKILTDTNQILQKFNRYISPQFSSIRTKEYNTGDGKVVVIYMPESKGKTHIFVKDVNYKLPSGTQKKIINAGMVFIRRSSTNQVLMPEDLEFIINRRIDYFRESILTKIAKVVAAPPDHNVIVFDPKSSGEDDNKFSITDSDSAIPIKGMSFTVTPSTDYEECCGWISLAQRDPTFLPSHERLWHIFSIRESFSFNQKQLLEIMRFALLLEQPVFFWIKDLFAHVIKQKLTMVFDETKAISIKANCLRISAFLGKTLFSIFLKRLESDIKRIDTKCRKFPSDPFQLFHISTIESRKGNIKKCNEEELRIKLESELSKNAEKYSKKRPGVLKKMDAIAIDCYLYSRLDKYLIPKVS